MVPLLPKIENKCPKSGPKTAAKSVTKPKPVNNDKNSDVDSESLLNKFLAKNDLKFLENYLSLQESSKAESELEIGDFAGLLRLLSPQEKQNCENGPAKFMGNSHLSHHSIDIDGKWSNKQLVCELQRHLQKSTMTAVAEEISDTSNSDDEDEKPVQTYYKKSCDLLLYYKIFNYWVQSMTFTNGVSMNNPNNPVYQLLKRLEPLFREAVVFSNKIMGQIDDQDHEDHSAKLFNFDTLSENTQHLSLIERFKCNANEEIPNGFLLVHWICKNYDNLNYHNLNYLLFLVNCYIPLPESKASCSEEPLKKLKSCSRCRKNKIKCDSMLKFPYSCSNCFKKNISFIKIAVKKMSQECEDAEDAADDMDDEDNRTLVNDLVSANYFENVSLDSNIKMARTPSSITTSSTLTNISLTGSPSSDAEFKENDYDMKLASGLEQALDPKLKFFLSLLKIDIKKIVAKDGTETVSFSIDSSNDDCESNGVSILSCKIQLLPSDLILKKKSLKKNNLIKSLRHEIDDLKFQIDELVVKEQKMLQKLNASPVFYDNKEIKRLCDLKKSFLETQEAAEKSNAEKIEQIGALSTNEFLVLNGFKPVVPNVHKKRKHDDMSATSTKKYFDYLEKGLKKSKKLKVNDEISIHQLILPSN